MKKLIPMLILLLLLLMPNTVLAHSKLVTSTPQADSTVAQSPQNITMTFNTSIENLSTFKVLNSNQNEIAISDITVQNDQLSGTVSQDLTNGTYEVNWSIIGADGHAVQGSYSFTVETEETETPQPEPEASPAASEVPTVSDEPTQSVPEQPTTVTAEEDSAQKSSAWVFIVIAAIIVIVVAVALKKRK